MRATALRCAAALSMAVVLAAHVGSPDVYFTGMAGPYAVDVIVRPPQVVPGVAEILIHVSDSGVRRVVVRPVFWRTGTKGAPVGDDAKVVAGAAGTYAGRLWLMTSGAYSVNVTVTGLTGSGTVVVPVQSVATGQLRLTGPLKWLLAVLAALLLAGMVTVVHAAAGEAQVDVGDVMTPERRRAARRAAIITVPALALIVFGAARWWDAEAERYTQTLYRPMATHAVVNDAGGIPTLTMTVTDTSWNRHNFTPLIPDHGKTAHLFVARADSPFVFVHLHPSMVDFGPLASPLPPLPPGRYLVLADVVHESGFERTFADSFTLAAPTGKGGLELLTADEAWSSETPTTVGAAPPAANAGGRSIVQWAGPAHVATNEPGVLRFSLADSVGSPLLVEPYLGMAGHAVVIRDDGKVFVHLHPSGSASMAAQMAFVLRDRGDTTGKGRLRLESMAMPDSAAVRMSELRFPYAFPSAGRYHVWVQLRVAGIVRTSGFAVTVADSLAR